MELWFIISVIGMIVTGVSNFFFKIVAARGLNAELFMLYSSLTSIVIAGGLVWWSKQPMLGFGVATAVLLGSGIISAVSGSLKVYALRYIDSTIYFPLFKLVTPALAICAGVLLFGESFTVLEWVGLAVGLLVPLILITPAENTRQQNLTLGLVLVVVTGIISALTAVSGKYAIDAAVPVFSTLLFTVIGIAAGALGLIVYRRGVRGVWHVLTTETDLFLLKVAITRASLISFGVWTMLFAFSQGGTLSVVQTIHSMYILIPVVLAIVFYHEHWNWQKAAAIALSVASLALLG